MSANLKAIEKKPETGIIVTLGELVEAVTGINGLLAERLPISYAYRLGKIAKACKAEIEQYEAMRIKLCEEHAEKNSEGQPVMIPTKTPQGDGEAYKIAAGQEGALESEVQTLKATEVTIPGAHFKVSELNGVSIASVYLVSLSWLFTD